MAECHVALLRGINVGGHRKLPMAELRSLCESLDVKTYIQSGNVVFRSAKNWRTVLKIAELLDELEKG